VNLGTVIVEDEPLARRALRDLVAADPDLELLAEARDGLEAVEVIERLQPALIFLDVHMPELSGLEVLERIEVRPAIVFTTAYDEHAVTAFELGAADYLLKPFGAARFNVAVSRVKESLATPTWDIERLRDSLEPTRPLTRLFARQGKRLVPILLDKVIRFEGSGDYVEVHTPGRSLLVSVTLSELERRLDPDRFVRVHRSHIVNLDEVAEITAEDERRLRIRCADGAQVVASREGSARLRALMR